MSEQATATAEPPTIAAVATEGEAAPRLETPPADGEPPSPPRHRGRALRWVLAAAALAAAWLLSPDLRGHLRVLLAHLGSGSWDVTTDRRSVEERIRLKYGAQPEAWAVRFVAGSGEALSLDTSHRDVTLQALGTSVYRGAGAALDHGALPAAYGAFLAESILALAAASPDAASPLAQLASSLSPPAAGPLPSPGSIRRARAALAELPQSAPLVTALDAYDEYRESRGLDFPAFEVTSTPPFDTGGEWERQSQALGQEARCQAAVTPLGGEGDRAEAELASFPRALEVHLQRPWLSDQLLSLSARGRTPLAGKYFGADGPLRMIPERLWLLLGDQVRFRPSAPHVGAVRRWVAEGRCCQLACASDTATWRVEPSSVVRAGDRWVATVEQAPILFAVVARRRTPA